MPQSQAGSSPIWTGAKMKCWQLGRRAAAVVLMAFTLSKYYVFQNEIKGFHHGTIPKNLISLQSEIYWQPTHNEMNQVIIDKQWLNPITQTSTLAYLYLGEQTRFYCSSFLFRQCNIFSPKQPQLSLAAPKKLLNITSQTAKVLN